MSGGVGPPYSDISLPKEPHELQQGQYPTSSKLKTAGSLPFRQINALAVIIVLSASGMVSPGDFAFVLFSFIYIYFLSKFAFPTLPSSKDPQAFNPQNKFLRLSALLGVIIGLVLPIAYIFEGIMEGDKRGIKAAAPHVFLLASQVFMDGAVFSDRFLTLIRVFVPVFYNSKRIFTLVEWLKNEFSKEVYGASARRMLAVANLAFWSLNLFGFLLLVHLPAAFKKYYSAHKESILKMVPVTCIYPFTTSVTSVLLSEIWKMFL